MTSTKINEDEIDFKEIYTKVSQSIILIILTTSIFTIIGFFVAKDNQDYQLNFSIEFGEKTIEVPHCSRDLFSVYFCWEETSTLNLFNKKEIQLFTKNLKSEFDSSFIESSFLNQDQSILVSLKSQDIGLLNSTLTKITDNVEILDNKKINQMVEQKLSYLKHLQKALEKSISKKNMDGENQAISKVIEYNLLLTIDDEYPLSQITPINPKSIIQDTQWKNTLFGFAFGLFISVSISLFRNKKIKK